MVGGVGIDIVSIESFGSAVERWGERLTGRLFTESELELFASHKSADTHLAGRFAAKVAVKRSLKRPCSYLDIEILRDDLGGPAVTLRGEAARVSLSISHDGGYCIAQSIFQNID